MLNLIEQFRKWITLLKETNDEFFNEQELDFLEQYNIPIYGMIEELKDFETSNKSRLKIKNLLSILLDDGGFWGETINAHSLSASNLKQKILNLRDSIKN